MHSRPMVSLLLRAILATIVAASLPAAARAQKPVQPNAGCPPGGCTFTVSVTPDGTAMERPPNSGPYTAIFNVENIGNSSGGYTLTCTKSGGITCVSISPTGVSLTPGADANVNVQYRVGSTGGFLRLTAAHGSYTNVGQYNVSAVTVGPPVVALRHHNRDNVDRSLCLTAGAGESAAWGCGDLVIAHSMPGFSTMGQERALTLIHNSATAYPRPPIAAVVTQPNGVALPNTVFAELKVGTTVRASATYYGWPSSTSPSRQIVLDFNGAGDPTGAYPIELRVQNRYTGSVHETLVKDTLLIVNRFVDEFGAGFAVAGVEQLIFSQPVGTDHILWVGGDGSAKLYRNLNASTWVPPLGTFPDTITLSGGVYTRTLRHGIQVKFNSAGRHIATINRTGQQTTFTWNTQNRLTSIQVPPACGAACTYILAWDVNQNLDYIQDPAGRKLDATFAANDGRLTSLKDPDGTSVVLGWDGDRRIISRRGRRGFTTTYEYSLGRAVGSRVTKVTVPVGRVVEDNTTAVTIFAPWNDKGLAVGATGQSAMDTAQSTTLILGPRTGVADDATFWVDRWGAPTRIVTPVPGTTRLTRGDANVPALVTQVVYPNNRIVKMSYNGRGNLTGIRDSTSHLGSTGLPFIKSTTYTYDSTSSAPDSPIVVTDGLGRTTRYNYVGLGLTDSVIDQRGHRTKFVYDTTITFKGLIKQIIERQVETWQQSDSMVETRDHIFRFAYDARGNAKVDTAANKTVTSYVRDAAGRVTSMFDPFNTERTWVYDPLNRVKQSISYPVAMTNPYGLAPAGNCDATQVVCADQTVPTNPSLTTLTTNYRYGPIDLDSVVDPRFVRRSFSHDARGLVWKEVDERDSARTASYGLGGTLDTSTSRAGLKVTYQYDVLGRRTQMQYPQRVFNGICDFDTTAVCANRDTIPGETITYTYDSLNNLLTASGAQGSITRRYYEDGSLRMKITSISGLAPDTLIYSYDPSGARTHLIHGRDMRDTTHYFYGGSTGDLDSMKIRYGAPLNQTYTFGFVWDGLGRRKQVIYPIKNGANRMSVTLSYDAAGTLREVRSAHPDSLQFVSNRLNFTFRNGLVDAVGRILEQTINCRMLSGDLMGSACAGNGPDRTINRYNRFSMLVKQTHSYGDRVDVDSMGYDASGNMRFRRDGRTGVFHSFTMPSYSNRLEIDNRSGTQYFYTYTEDGSRRAENATSIDFEEQWYKYDGLERMSGSMRWDVGAQAHLVDNPISCQYDPDGQMVRPCDNAAPKLAFEGNNVIAAGNVGVNWSFVHGPALDDPLMGLARWTGGTPKVFFWVTDGQGRHFVFADSTGDLSLSEYNTRYGQNGGKYAGGTSSAGSFNADRFSTLEIPGFSFFRNRAYDRNTGRWTQEDPIGVAGGINLYQFNGNNPVLFTDPFGLKECEERGNCTQADGGEGEADLYKMRNTDVIASTDASPLLLIGAIQSSAGRGAVRLAGPAAAGEAKILAEFFGRRAAGALSRLESKTLTPGITREMLEKYAETVARPIVNGTARVGRITERAIETQSARLDLIVAALKDWF